MKQKKRKFSVYLSDSDIKQLDYVAKELHTTRGEMVRKELEKFVLKLKHVFGEQER